MPNIKDQLLQWIATTAEEVFLESMGLASCGGAYELEIPEEVKTYKTVHTSKLESIFDKIAK